MKKTISDITNEQIIQSARRQRQSVNSRMEVEPWKPRHHHGRGIAAIITIAASLISFIAGYGIHSKMSQPITQPMAQVVQVQHDTIMMTETIRDTIYQTRIVTKQAKPKRVQPAPTTNKRMLASNETQETTSPSPARQSSAEQMACSMLCDDIPYDLLATP